ncbi:hypothetical protein [Bathymodiolus japonicus methanotrophic gill symbiont]|uniref:hypothetical protein n=1 Tax=Bathymodiolus japonicus methanotrophic gill symbiont TaxID=113269 RepID=UPI001C8E4AB3|nr:hypothetical protein [Bathymodiolus japonicus methanotrophic gill symbiont]
MNIEYYEQLCLIDKNIDPRPISEFIADADHIYIGGMMAQEQSLIKLGLEVKKFNKLLIVGGTAISPQSPLMQITDHLLENEAEGVIDELLEGLSKAKAKKYYKGGFNSPEFFSSQIMLLLISSVFPYQLRR